MNIFEIINKNNKTYYGFDEHGNQTTCWREKWYFRVFFNLVMALLVFFGGNISNKDFLTSLISTTSILLGFSFSVLFFLISSDGAKIGDSSHLSNSNTIESKAKSQDIKDMRDELVINITYFVLVSIICLFFSLLLLIPSDFRFFKKFLNSENISRLKFVVFLLSHVVEVVVSFLIIESISSFFRISHRTTSFLDYKNSNEY